DLDEPGRAGARGAGEPAARLRAQTGRVDRGEHAPVIPTTVLVDQVIGSPFLDQPPLRVVLIGEAQLEAVSLTEGIRPRDRAYSHCQRKDLRTRVHEKYSSIEHETIRIDAMTRRSRGPSPMMGLTVRDAPSVECTESQPTCNHIFISFWPLK